MSWIDTVLNLLFPPPVPLSVFGKLPQPGSHDHYSWIFAATRYKSDAKKIIRYLKSTPDANYIHATATVMAKILESYVLDIHSEDTQSIILVPVPQHTDTTQNRGYNQAELMARAISKLLRYTPVQGLLLKAKKTEKQALLPRNKRLSNQTGSFVFNEKSNPIHPDSLVVIIDDVSTTGTTLLACKTTLHERGFKNVIGLVFAH